MRRNIIRRDTEVAEAETELYVLLRQVFGNVRISDGSYYVCCPFCNDSRYRLCFGKNWGSIPPGEFEPVEYAATCFNEDCLKRHYGELKQKVLGDRKQLEPPRVIEGPPVIPYLPDETVSLATLPPEHPAVVYATGRGFSVPRLAGRWAVGYAPWVYGEPRLVIPFFFRNALAGWQARVLREDAAVKYFTMPGMKKSRLLYNYDAAALGKTIIVVEGVVDVWSVGDCGVAACGHKFSETQLTLLGDWLREDGERHVMVLFDRDTHAKNDSGNLHSQLRSHLGERARSFVLGERDPGSSTRKELLECLRPQLAKSATWLRVAEAALS